MAKRNDASSGGDESVLALQPCKQTEKKKNPSDHITINIYKTDNEQGPAVVPCRTQGTLLNAL